MLPPAKSADQMQTVVTNSTVDGILAALFAVLIIIVIVDAARVWVKAIRAREPLAEHRGARGRVRAIVAPAGLFWTPEEQTVLAGAGANGGGRRPRRARRGRHHDRIEVAMTLKRGVRRRALVPARGVAARAAYDRYVEHMRRDHPDQLVMSRREYERQRMRMRDENPRARCC